MRRGDAVIVNGYPGRVAEEYMAGMYEVVLPTGIVVVPTSEILPRPECHCPDDCGCHKPWRPTICGCAAHR